MSVKVPAINHIKQLGNVIQSYLKPGTRIIGHNCTKITKPGDNYGGILMAVDVQVEEDGQQRTMNLLAKMIPDNEYLQKQFKIQETFVKEMNFYEKVVPDLLEFQRDNGMKRVMSCFPKYYGGRINLDASSDKVDGDAVMIMENLKSNGYVLTDRRIGFDFKSAEFILDRMAIFHAVPMAYKMKKPTAFAEKILSHVKYARLFEDMDHSIVINRVERIAREMNTSSRYAERAVNALVGNIETYKPFFAGPFNTIVHNDLWVNNIMMKVVSDEPHSNKFIDFQLVDHSSLGKDVLFFIFSSVQNSVVQNNYDRLIKQYYDRFIRTMLTLECDTSPFTFEGFQEELELAAKRSEFYHALHMAQPMHRSPGAVREMRYLTADDINKSNEITPDEKQKVSFIIQEFAKRKWI